MGSRVGETLTDESAIAAIRQLIEERVPSKKAVICGFSMGGHLALKFAHAHPDMCIAVIAGGCCNEYPPGVKSSLFVGGAEFIYDHLPNSVTSTFVLKMIPKRVDPKNAEFLMRTSMYYRAWAGCGSIH